MFLTLTVTLVVLFEKYCTQEQMKNLLARRIQNLTLTWVTLCLISSLESKDYIIHIWLYLVICHSHNRQIIIIK